MKNLRITLLLLSTLFLQSCYIKTNETEIGVKIKKFALFGDSGVSDEIYAPGRYHIYIPFFQEIRKFNTKLQTISMDKDPNKGTTSFRDDLLFKTIDGNDISLDVIIQYRINPKQAPHILQYVALSDEELKQTVLRTVVRSFPRDIFGEMKTEDFYNAQSREEKSQKVKSKLNEFLNPLGVIIESVLTVDYRFNKAYQQAIEDKKVADQQAEKNKSATAAAVEEYKRKLEETKGQVNEMIAVVDGEFRKAKIEADAYYEKMSQLAKAIEAEGIAEAKAISKLNKALAGAGGRTMVKLEIAKAIKGKKIILLPLSGGGGMNLKTTNVNDLLQIYGIKTLGNSN